MSTYVIRRDLTLRSGVLNLGADVVLQRGAANRLDTPDALQVSGTANIVGAALLQGSVTMEGTPVVLPYGTTSPGDAVNGEFNIYHKSHVSYLSFRAGGTAYSIGLPSATHGTVTITIGSPP